MSLVIRNLFIFGVAIRLSQCAPTGNGYRLISKNSKSQVPNDLDAIDNQVEIYTFNHAKCDGMDFQGIIILTKVQNIKGTNCICYIYQVFYKISYKIIF